MSEKTSSQPAKGKRATGRTAAGKKPASSITQSIAALSRRADTAVERLFGLVGKVADRLEDGKTVTPGQVKTLRDALGMARQTREALRTQVNAGNGGKLDQPKKGGTNP